MTPEELRRLAYEEDSLGSGAGDRLRMAADTIEGLRREKAVLTANLEIMCPGGEAELAAMREKTELVEALNVSEALRRKEVAELEEQIKSLLAASVSR